eukprot:3257639-Ditylum_brightwellii.AAC.1
MSTVWKKIGHGNKKNEIGSISSLQVTATWPDPHCDILGITMLDDHQKQVTEKAHGTPFTVHPLSSEIDWAANSITSELENATIGDKINIEERTTTSLSRKYLGHYKALLERGPDDPKSGEGKDVKANQDTSINVHVDYFAMIRNIWQNLTRSSEERKTINNGQ